MYNFNILEKCVDLQKSTLFKKENTEMEDHPSPDAGNVDYRVLEREAQK